MSGKKDRGLKGPIYAILFCMLCVMGYLFDRDYVQESAFEKTYLQGRRFDRLSANCAEDHANECNRLGMVHENGHGTELDHKKAFDAYSKACGLNSKYGCFNVGRYYIAGDVVEKDYKKALENYEIACFDRNHKWSCGAAGALRLYAPNSELWNDKLAFDVFSKGCNITHEPSCAAVGMIRLQNRVKPPSSPARTEKAMIQARDFLRRNCLDKPIPAEPCAFYFEEVYELGDPKRDAAVVAAAKSVCREKTCPLLGVFARRGIGMEKDLAKASEYFGNNCEPSLEGNWICGWRGMTELERGNIDLARQYLEPACKQNNQFMACRSLNSLEAD